MVHLQHVSVQFYHLQGEKMPVFKNPQFFFNWHSVLPGDCALLQKYVGDAPLTFILFRTVNFLWKRK